MPKGKRNIINLNSNIDKKGLILEAAVRIFSQKGFHKAKVEEIAVDAGIGKGTVYEYFTSKKMLFHEIILGFLQKYTNTIEKNLSSSLNPRDALLGVLKEQMAFVMEHQDISILIMNEYKNLDKEFEQGIFQAKKRNLKIIAQHIEDGIEKGFFKKVNPLTAAIIIEGTINSLTGAKLCLKKDLAGEVLEDLERIMLEGLEKD